MHGKPKHFILLLICVPATLSATSQSCPTEIDTRLSAPGYPTQSHYPDTLLTSPCPILLLSSARLDSDKYNFYKLLAWLRWDSISQHSAQKACTLPIRPSHPVNYCRTNHAPGIEGDNIGMISGPWPNRSWLDHHDLFTAAPWPGNGAGW